MKTAQIVFNTILAVFIILNIIKGVIIENWYFASGWLVSGILLVGLCIESQPNKK